MILKGVDVMDYTIQRLAKMSGVSTRTLRYYDEIGLLKPAKINSSGYRIYGKEEIDRLQQILFYRYLEFDLNTIRRIITSPDFDVEKALFEHRDLLLEKKSKIDLLIANIDKTLAAREGRMIMNDNDKFIGFKKKMISDNEEKFGAEVREKFGDDAADTSNRKLMGLTADQYARLEKLSEEVMSTLDAAFKTKDPAGELAQKAADLHRKWLCFFWDKYDKEAHASLARMYVDDSRFAAFYDRNQPGKAEFLRDAILIYVKYQK
jgi:DNA-binding transcriptional MerR regulator